MVHGNITQCVGYTTMWSQVKISTPRAARPYKDGRDSNITEKKGTVRASKTYQHFEGSIQPWKYGRQMFIIVLGPEPCLDLELKSHKFQSTKPVGSAENIN